MTEGIEHALEYVVAGAIFCMAIAMLLLLHAAFVSQAKTIGKTPERVILFEQKG